MKRCVTVYCGASDGLNPAFVEAARTVGRLLAEAGVEVITGAGATGMMRAVADGAMHAGGTVHGIIPRFMVERGWDYKALTKITVTETIHARKELMAQLSCAAIALPGGAGTWEELMEIITWKQLGLYAGNVAVLNLEYYYEPVASLINNGYENGFIKSDVVNAVTFANTPEDVVKAALKLK